MSYCTKTQDIDCYIQDQIQLIETALAQLIPENDETQRSLFLGSRYSLLNGGKRLRPILMLATVSCLNGNVQHASIPACALEMIHTYSLIHDDLPCMDNDDFRRGKPTLHKVVTEGQAVLVGDFLLTYAFELLATAPELTEKQKIALITVLSRKSGSHGMIGGQMMDLESEDQEISLSHLQQIHHAKTGALLSAALEMGCIIAQASESTQKTLHLFGYDIGLAFQIIDDVLDVVASHQKHGKAIASDVVNHKSTYVTLLGVETSKRKAEELLNTALARLDALPGDFSLLKGLADKLVNRSI